MDNKDQRFVKRIELDLGDARDREEHVVFGDVILMEKIDGEADIYFNDDDINFIELDKTRKFYMDFWRIFITNAAQAGKTCTILVGRMGVFDGDVDVAKESTQIEMRVAIEAVQAGVAAVQLGTDNLDSAMSTLATHVKQDLQSTTEKQDELISYYKTAWDLDMLEYIQENGVWGTPADDPYDIYMNPDGMKAYCVGNDDDEINEFILYTPHNVLLMEYVRSFSVAAKETFPTGLTFKNDGTKMYVYGLVSNRIHEYDLGTPWDISTAVWLQQSMDLDPTDTNMYSLYLNAEGTKAYLHGDENNILIECTLGTPWDISTLTVTNTMDISDYFTTIRGGTFLSNDGKRMWLTGSSKIIEFNLAIAWDISTASVSKGISVAPEGNSVNGIWWKPDGLALFLGCNNVPEVIAQYDL